MLLAVDIGNTNIDIRLIEGDVIKSHWRIGSNESRTSDEYGVLFRKLIDIKKIDTDQIKGATISCVVPTLLETILDAIQIYFDVSPIIVGPGVKTGMPILYHNPKEVGADRIVNGVGAYEKFHKSVIVVDFGTATTFDVVSASGDYQGGVIALGLMGASEELHRISAKLPRVALDFPESVVGKTTEASMQSGILWGTLAMVDGMVRYIKAELGISEMAVVATGGIAKIFHDKSNEIEHIEPYLTLEGMRLIYNHVMSSR